MSRGIRDGTLPPVWPALYVASFLAMPLALALRGASRAVVIGTATLLALVTSAAMLTDLLAPFEAFRTRPGLPTVQTLCELTPGLGAWSAIAGWCLGLVATVQSLHPRVPSGTSRALVATVAGLVAVAYAWPWAYVLADALVASPDATWVVLLILILVAAAVVAPVWSAPRGRRLWAHTLLSLGATMVAGPLLLGILRLTGIGREGAAVLTDWSGNELIGPIVIGVIAVLGVGLAAAGLLVARPRTTEAPAAPGA